MKDMVVKSTVATIQSGAAKADGKFWITELS
ncbi:hypothetical protein PSECIP111951_02742 [Pseudoalteromonas holothuriae]|uniref:Uncharacterized protein n=1 Tax=Pseudoalteromonas holothuriae TaxID=2963714 RepID=A0A9W4QVJ2_9GAMM|nr:hypothetical protein PSECIP111854_01520 [Pseudoalteromonas sp. CIP111854]CAH9062681.1 hypothetical protein PSECIP111951_02742 [Pseudoalteromonas sp. CIP111951]